MMLQDELFFAPSFQAGDKVITTEGEPFTGLVIDASRADGKLECRSVMTQETKLFDTWELLKYS